MFLALFAVSFLLALAIAAAVAWLAKEVIVAILNRFYARHISAAATKYLQFAIVLVGVASGTRARLLEDYIAAPSWNKEALRAELTQEVWVASLYHTFIDSLEGIAWLLIIFAFLVLVALFLIRKSKVKWLLADAEQPKLVETEDRVRSIR